MRCVLAVSLILACSPAWADGLIYSLPEDGASIQYDAEVSAESAGSSQEYSGSTTVSSVGKETVDGKACRWIEFKLEMKMGNEDRIIRAKALVPEAELGKGKGGVDHLKEAWFLRPGANKPQKIESKSARNAGPLPAFLAGKFEDQKELPEETIKTGLGELKCKGVTGTTSFEQSGRTHKYTFTNRLNDKAPFGVVTSEIKFTMTGENGEEQTGAMKLTAKKIGAGAKSEIETSE